MTFKPMLAVEYDPEKLIFPKWASPKIDGIRASNVNGKLKSRSLKDIPNEYIRTALSFQTLHGLDGELTVGDPTAPTLFSRTSSVVMSHNKRESFVYHLFDYWDSPESFDERQKLLKTYILAANKLADGRGKVVLVEQKLIKNMDDLLEYEARHTSLGYEGIMLRDPNSPYKYGRSTVKEGYLLKVKRFLDSECEILELIEEMENQNEKTTNELGRSKRSSHKENKVGKGQIGACRVRDVHTGIIFHIGSGISDDLGQRMWDYPKEFLHSVWKYKYFPVGVKDLPRHPVLLAPRHKEDM
jgi:DNA ligase-1